MQSMSISHLPMNKAMFVFAADCRYKKRKKKKDREMVRKIDIQHYMLCELFAFIQVTETEPSYSAFAKLCVRV